MISEPDYACDPEFSRLLRRETEVDLPRAALEIARDEYPDVDVDHYMSWFDEAAGAIRPKLYRAGNEAETLSLLVDELCGQRGFYGTSDAFRDPRCAYLNRVIDIGRGLPITLAAVYMGVADRLEIGLAGVASPMHFVCRMESVDGPLFLDAFSKGRILNEAQCLEWLHRVSQLPEETIVRSLGPVEPRLIVIRILNNLKAQYAQREKWNSLWKVQHRLTALQPGNWQERRDLGMVSLHANRPGQAVKLLSDCLNNCPNEAEKDAMEHLVEQAQALLAKLN